MKTFIEKHMKKLLALGIIVIALVVILATRDGGADDSERFIVERTDAVQTVNVTGTVEAQSQAMLGFSTTGRVEIIFVTEGDVVRRGETLARLDVTRLQAQLNEAQATLAIRTFERQNQSTSTTNDAVSLDTVRAQQDNLVANAYRTMLSTDLIAEPRNDTYTQTPPVITGLYTGVEGEYKIRIVKENVSSDDYIVRTFRLEEWEGEVAPNKAMPFGTKGLYISFSEALEEYDDTVWYLRIPNTSSPSYAVNKNAYDSAVQAREVAIENSRATFEETDVTSPIRDAEIVRAQSNIQQLRADIADRVIRAPFDGVLTNRMIEVGETAVSGETAFELFSDGTFQLNVNVPEIDIAKIELEDEAIVQLDAFDEGDTIVGRVIQINPASTKIDGVSYYEVTITLDSDDERVRAGMTADVAIKTDEFKDVVVVPLRFVTDAKVDIVTGEETATTQDVVVGAAVDGGRVVITDGVAGGDTLIRSTD